MTRLGRSLVAMAVISTAMDALAIDRDLDLSTEKIAVHAFATIQYVAYDSRNMRSSGLELDRFVLRLDGILNDQLSWRVTPDLVGVDTAYGLEEAWLAYSESDLFRSTLGVISIPLGVEDAIRKEHLAFSGHSFPSYIDGRTDVGIMLDGQYSGGLLCYELSAALGEGFDRNGQELNSPQLAARAVSYPLRRSTAGVRSIMEGFFLGGAYAWGPDFEGELDVATPVRNKLFNTDVLTADEYAVWHISWGIDAGSLRIMHEFERASLLGLELTDGSTEDLDDQITAWSATVSWMIHGPDYDSRPFQQRATPPRSNAWELAIRYANADLDREFFRLGFTDYDISSQEFRSATGAINWYANERMRVSAQVVRTIADQRPMAFDSHGRDTSYTLFVVTCF